MEACRPLGIWIICQRQNIIKQALAKRKPQRSLEIPAVESKDRFHLSWGILRNNVSEPKTSRHAAALKACSHRTILERS